MADDVEQVLKQVVARLDDVGVPWAVTGSMSLFLQGVAVDPADVDLQTTDDGVPDLVQALTGEVELAPTQAENPPYRSMFAVVRVDGVAVDVMGDLSLQTVDGGWVPAPDVETRTTVTVDGAAVPVIPLQEQMAAYRALGREDRVKKIQAVLGRNPV